jgi:hypothetical protein
MYLRPNIKPNDTFYPYSESSERQGAIRLSRLTTEDLGIQVYEIGRDSLVQEDKKILKPVKQKLERFLQSFPHFLIEDILLKFDLNQFPKHRYLIASEINSKNLVGVLQGDCQKGSVILHNIISFKRHSAYTLLTTLMRNHQNKTLIVKKGDDQWFNSIFQDNNWQSLRPLKGFYEQMGFQNVPEGCAEISAPYEQIKPWLTHKSKQLIYYKNRKPESLVIKGIGDGNTITPN